MVARARDEMDPAMKTALDGQYAGFNAPDAALDPVQIVRRYADVRDREIVAFIAAGLAFGRVASIMASIEAVTAVMAPSPAAFVRGFDRRRDGARVRLLVRRQQSAWQTVRARVQPDEHRIPNSPHPRRQPIRKMIQASPRSTGFQPVIFAPQKKHVARQRALNGGPARQ